MGTTILNFVLKPVASATLSLLKGYLAKLATKEFIQWAIFEVADAAVKSTKTEVDDKWLEKIKETIK